MYSGDKRYATGKKQQFTLQETIIHSYKIEMELKKHLGRHRAEERLGVDLENLRSKIEPRFATGPHFHIYGKDSIFSPHLSHPIFYFKAVSSSGLWGFNKVQVSNSAVSPWECSSALNSNESAEQFTQVFACQL